MRNRIKVVIASAAALGMANFRLIPSVFSGSTQSFNINDFILPRVLNDVMGRANISLDGFELTKGSSSSRQYPKKDPLAVFYNIFVPKNTSLVLDIIEEQINQIATSYITTPKFNTTIYYATLARRLPEDFMEELCHDRNGLTCQHLKHYKQGNEEVTLAALHDYCRLHPDERVVYIHAKGRVLVAFLCQFKNTVVLISRLVRLMSVDILLILYTPFWQTGSMHNTSHNAMWRKPLLEAATHKDCINLPKSCNVCGLQFFPTWAHFMPGNFWTAQCRYINKLLHPTEYRNRKEILVRRLRRLEEENLIDRWIFQDAVDDEGLERYSVGTQICCSW